MTNLIMDTGNVAELTGLDESDEISNMEALKEPTGKGIEFHVAMRGHTMHDMEELIVQAAAQQIVGKFGNDRLAKEIEAKTISLVTAKADKALQAVTAEIIDQPILPKYSYSKSEATPVTMREFIGLTGRQYLAERVDINGNVSDRSSYNEKSRMQYLVEKYMETAFKREIEKATNAAIVEVRAAIEASHKAFLAAEKKRFHEALEKITA